MFWFIDSKYLFCGLIMGPHSQAFICFVDEPNLVFTMKTYFLDKLFYIGWIKWMNEERNLMVLPPQIIYKKLLHLAVSLQPGETASWYIFKIQCTLMHQCTPIDLILRQVEINVRDLYSYNEGRIHLSRGRHWS